MTAYVGEQVKGAESGASVSAEVPHLLFEPIRAVTVAFRVTKSASVGLLFYHPSYLDKRFSVVFTSSYNTYHHVWQRL